MFQAENETSCRILSALNFRILISSQTKIEAVTAISLEITKKRAKKVAFSNKTYLLRIPQSCVSCHLHRLVAGLICSFIDNLLSRTTPKFQAFFISIFSAEIVTFSLDFFDMTSSSDFSAIKASP